MKKQRIVAYDNQKFLLIFLVVWGHLVAYCCSMDHAYARIIFIAIYFFHMPAFIFLSGLMRNVDAPLNKKTVLSFFILGVFYKIMNTLVVGLGSGKWVFHLLDEDGIPWFMFAMAVWPVMAYVLRNVKPIVTMILTVSVGCLAGFDQNLTSNYMLLCRILVYFPFYMLGCYLDPEKLLRFCKKRVLVAGSAIVAVSYIYAMITKIDMIYKLRHIVTGKNLYNEWAMAHGHLLLRLFCYVGAFVMILVLISLVPNRKLPIVSKYGTRTLSVYMWHINLIRIMIYSGVEMIIFNVIGNGIVGTAVISLIMTIILSWKYLAYPIDYFMKGIYIKNKRGTDL